MYAAIGGVLASTPFCAIATDASCDRSCAHRDGAERGPKLEIPGLLPVEITAFGDIQYRFQSPGSEEFRVGSLELDAALTLAPSAVAAAAIAYDTKSNGMVLASFVVDGGLVGEGEHYLVQSEIVQRSGIIVGRFDVPFGVAYLEYPSVAGRFASLPKSVSYTHAGWNDIGAQFYAVNSRLNLVGYFVNGQEHQAALEDGTPQIQSARFAGGGRLGLSPLPGLELGCSLARTAHESGHRQWLFGVDLTAQVEHLDLRAEYLSKDEGDGGSFDTRIHGAYGRAIYRLGPLFWLLRYDVVLEGQRITERTLDGGASVRVFPGGEVRALITRGFDDQTWVAGLQIVGGSTFQPTGLRHTETR